MHTDNTETGTDFSISILALQVSAADTCFWNRSSSGSEHLNTGPEMFRDDQISLQPE